MAGRKLTNLQMERDSLMKRWMHDKGVDRAKILVQLMDLDEDIDLLRKQEHIQSPRKVSYTS